MSVMSVMGFAHLLTELATELPTVTRAGLAEAAEVIATEAKAEIGHYQAAAGPFQAWAPLADATVKDRVSKGFSPNEPLLRTGGMRDSIETTVSRNSAEIGSNSDIAVYQELGTSKIPPRSFLGGAAVRKEDEVVRILGEHVKAHLEGGGSVTPIR
jgi:HK97 gp10 family phage protein